MQYGVSVPCSTGGQNRAQTCSPAEWAVWHRVNLGLEKENEFFETVNVDVSAEEKAVDVEATAGSKGWDASELMFFVFEFGPKQGLEACQKTHEMKSGQETEQNGENLECGSEILFTG